MNKKDWKNHIEQRNADKAVYKASLAGIDKDGLIKLEQELNSQHKVGTINDYDWIYKTDVVSRLIYGF